MLGAMISASTQATRGILAPSGILSIAMPRQARPGSDAGAVLARQSFWNSGV